MEWIKVSDKLPPNGKLVETKMHDSQGARNFQNLIRSGNLWYLSDKSMYTYYTPTHWREKQ